MHILSSVATVLVCVFSPGSIGTVDPPDLTSAFQVSTLASTSSTAPPTTSAKPTITPAVTTTQHAVPTTHPPTSTPSALATSASPAPGAGTADLPSGLTVPIGDLPGWHQTFVDDFTVNAPLGSWGTKNPDKVVYTGDHGGKWVEYPDGWASTYTNGKPGYRPAKVLSVHDGVLDFYLHNVSGLPSGANPSPLVSGTSQYQTYGRYTARIKSATVPNYHAAWLLWPVNDKNGACAESDFPETNLGKDKVTAFTHNAANCKNYNDQDEFDSKTRIDDGAWHTYTQEWGPGFRKYYIDSRLLGTSTTRVWSHDERWQLQTEPDGSGKSKGHLLVDWVAVYAYAPGVAERGSGN